MTPTRLVETGLDALGRSTVVSDRLVESRRLPTGRLVHELWADDGLIGASVAAAGSGIFPGSGGARFWIFTVPASDDGDALGLHQTATVDLGIVIGGGITMELEDGTHVDLRVGDVYVQNQTKHAWHNKGSVDAVVALTVIGVS